MKIQFLNVKKSTYVKMMVVNAMVKLAIADLKLNESAFTLTVLFQANMYEELDCYGMVSHVKKDIVMAIDPATDITQMLETVCHEMIHVKQIAKGQMKLIQAGEKIVWMGKEYPEEKYHDLPWEIEAMAKSERMYRKFSDALFISSGTFDIAEDLIVEGDEQEVTARKNLKFLK